MDMKSKNYKFKLWNRANENQTGHRQQTLQEESGGD